MKNSVQQEILLMTNSSLSKTNLCEKNSMDGKQFSNVERLEQACWNGMLDEFVPGLVMHVEARTLFLWEIQTAKSFLHIDLCDQVPSADNVHSIDPYIFLNELNLN